MARNISRAGIKITCFIAIPFPFPTCGYTNDTFQRYSKRRYFSICSFQRLLSVNKEADICLEGRRERRRDSILTLRFSWEEIIYRDRESENSNVSSNFLSNFLEKIQIYNNNSKHFRYSFRFHSFHRVSICYSIKRPISSLSSLLEIEQLFSMYLEQVNSEVSCRVSRDIVIRGQRRRQGWGEFSRGVACYLGARSGRN